MVKGSSTGTHAATRSPKASATRSTWRGQVRPMPVGSRKPRSSSENHPGSGPSWSTAHTSMPTSRAARSTSVTKSAKPVSQWPCRGSRRAQSIVQRSERTPVSASRARSEPCSSAKPLPPVEAGRRPSDSHPPQSLRGATPSDPEAVAATPQRMRSSTVTSAVFPVRCPMGKANRHRYSRWDGTQVGFDLDATDIFSEITDDLLYHGDLNAALRRMMQSGFQDANGERMQGLREMLEKLAREAARGAGEPRPRRRLRRDRPRAARRRRAGAGRHRRAGPGGP